MPTRKQLPIPLHFNPGTVGQVWKVPYEERANQARAWAIQHDLQQASSDSFRLGLLLVDVQNTFCLPGFELFVAGRSGTGAVDDNRLLCQFIYHNLAAITTISVTMDTHRALQIFHAIFLVDANGNHPGPYTLVSAEDIASGRWKFNLAVSEQLPDDIADPQKYLRYYTSQLKQKGKYDLTIWPYHAMLGGIGHALVPAIEEALFFHTVARYSQPDFIIKGDNPLTEHYSAIGPEVLRGPDGQQIARKNKKIPHKLQQADALVIAGQAKSHCVAWTIQDLLDEIQATDPSLAGKVYLLEDCTSPVVVPGVDFTEQADQAFKHFSAAGMHLVKSTTPIAEWPGISS